MYEVIVKTTDERHRIPVGSDHEEALKKREEAADAVRSAASQVNSFRFLASSTSAPAMSCRSP